ncbi:transthyretin-like protein 2 precursor [Aphelenchoides avenae]|nr:transthyretin-like protein 2 precursor [Aphelenchus avenae]
MKPSVLALLGVLAVNVLFVNAWGEQKVTVEGRFTCCTRSGGGQVPQSSQSTEKQVSSTSEEEQGPWVPPKQQQQQEQQQQKELAQQQQQQRKVPPKTQTQRKVPPKDQQQEQVRQSQQQQQQQRQEPRKMPPKQSKEQEQQQQSEQGPKLVSAEDSVQRKTVPKERRRRSPAAADRCIPEAQTGVNIELWDKDTFDSDDKLGETTTDARGNFHVSGSEFEVGSIEPYLVIAHDCEAAVNQKLAPGCNFETKVPVPKKYINGGPLVINSFEDFIATNPEASTVQSC